MLGLCFTEENTGGIIDHSGAYVTDKKYVTLILESYIDFYFKVLSDYSFKIAKEHAIYRKGCKTPVIKFKRSNAGVGVYYFTLFDKSMRPNNNNYNDNNNNNNNNSIEEEGVVEEDDDDLIDKDGDNFGSINNHTSICISINSPTSNNKNYNTQVENNRSRKKEEDEEEDEEEEQVEEDFNDDNNDRNDNNNNNDNSNYDISKNSLEEEEEEEEEKVNDFEDNDDDDDNNIINDNNNNGNNNDIEEVEVEENDNHDDDDNVNDEANNLNNKNAKSPCKCQSPCLLKDTIYTGIRMHCPRCHPEDLLKKNDVFYTCKSCLILMCASCEMITGTFDGYYKSIFQAAKNFQAGQGVTIIKIIYFL